MTKKLSFFYMLDMGQTGSQDLRCFEGGQTGRVCSTASLTDARLCFGFAALVMPGLLAWCSV